MTISKLLPLKFNYSYIIISLCVLVLSISTGLFLISNNFVIAIAIAILPVAIIILLLLMNYPHLIISLIAFSYVSNIQFKFGPISVNIFLVCLFIASLIVYQIKFKFIIGKQFFFFLCFYIIYAMSSYFFSHNSINFYDINLYINHVIFLIFMYIFNTKGKIEHFFIAVLCSAIVLLFSGIIQLAHLRYVPENGITGLFENHVSFGKGISWGIIICIYFFHKYRKKVYILIALCLLFGLIISRARGPQFSLIAGFFIYISILWIMKFKSRKILLTTSIIIALSCLISLYSFLIVKGSYGTKIGEITSGRSYFYQAAWEIFKENPFVGIGWDKFPIEWAKYVRIVNYDYGQPVYERNYHAHSSYLKILSELGLLGIVVYFLFNYYLMKDTSEILIGKEWSIFLYMLIFYFLFGIYDNDSFGNDRMFYFLSGILYALKTSYQENVANLSAVHGKS